MAATGLYIGFWEPLGVFLMWAPRTICVHLCIYDYGLVLWYMVWIGYCAWHGLCVVVGKLVSSLVTLFLCILAESHDSLCFNIISSKDKTRDDSGLSGARSWG